MHLKVLVPFEIFAQARDVTRIVADTRHGSLGLLEHRLDCVAALEPGILIYETASHGEICIAVDEGVLVKTGSVVSVSVRGAFGGTDLARLREQVEREFRAQREEEQDLRHVMTRLEASFLRRLSVLDHA